jgi:HEAT repeat protein
MDVSSFTTFRRIVLAARSALVAVVAVAGCSTYVGTTSKSFLRHVRTNPDPNIRYIAYTKLGAPALYAYPEEQAEAVKTLIAKLEEGREPLAIRAVILRSLGNLGDRRAREVVVRATQDPEGVIRAEACRALGKVGVAEDATTLARVMTVDNLEDCRIAAIEGIGSLRATDARILQILLEGMDHDDPAIRLSCYRALQQVTGKDRGNHPSAWRKELEPQFAAASGSSDTSRPTVPSGPTLKR